MRRRLTPEEIVAVDLATKGENFSHRRWPPDVVAAFAAADLTDAAEPPNRLVLASLRLRRLLPFNPPQTSACRP